MRAGARQFARKDVMFAFILRRLFATIPVMLVVAVFVFLMLRLTPSDPAAIIAGVFTEFKELFNV